MNQTILLGIETSCDETAAAIVEETADSSAPWRVRSNVVASQIDVHREWGGVVPELSARQHVRDICPVVERALLDSGSCFFSSSAMTECAWQVVGEDVILSRRPPPLSVCTQGL